MPAQRCEVAIVGAGPVGLLLACLLAQRGLDVRVFERRSERSPHSRAVGVHPPGLRCLAQAGVAEEVLARSVRVRRARAFADRTLLGELDFACLPDPYRYVLTVPQQETESALERRLAALREDALCRGAQIADCQLHADGATLRLAQHAGTVRARYVVGCDGKRSLIRAAARLGFPGGAYDAHFMMADTPDETPFAETAAVFLARDGLVESFPMPGGMRRWVVALERPAQHADASEVERLVGARTGQRADAARATMVSCFRAEHYLANDFVRGPLVLAGDAAHVLSPIGGQGMNLGWLDAVRLAELLPQALTQPERLAPYARERRRAARLAIRRAEAFMAVAARGRARALKALGVRALLSTPLQPSAARLFTMHGLA